MSEHRLPECVWHCARYPHTAITRHRWTNIAILVLP